MPYELYFGPTDKEFYFEIQGAVKHVLARSAIQTVGGGRKAGGRQEPRDGGNWALEWGRVETGGGCVAG
jgi:hypothetical protein